MECACKYEVDTLRGDTRIAPCGAHGVFGAAAATQEREAIAAYFAHLSTVQIGVIDLTGMSASEFYSLVASWIRNRVDVKWSEEMSEKKAR
jgi:hypothetical protein